MPSQPLKNNQTRILFLGTGTSTGIPFIGCDCETCQSTYEKDKRTRCSALISWMENSTKKNILIDTSTDLRTQALRFNLRQIDSVVYTHSHADHVHGIDELRSFNFIQKTSIPCYGSPRSLERIKIMFDYIFQQVPEGVTKPDLTLEPVEDDFDMFGRKVIALPANHGDSEVLGYRFGPIAYLTDCSGLPDSTMEKIRDVPLLVLGAVNLKGHAKHFSVSEAVEASQRVGAKKTYLIHLSHKINHEKISNSLPENVFLAYDGLEETVD